MTVAVFKVVYPDSEISGHWPAHRGQHDQGSETHCLAIEISDLGSGISDHEVIVHQGDLTKGIKSSYSTYHPSGAIHPVLQIVLVQNS